MPLLLTVPDPAGAFPIWACISQLPAWSSSTMTSPPPLRSPPISAAAFCCLVMGLAAVLLTFSVDAPLLFWLILCSVTWSPSAGVNDGEVVQVNALDEAELSVQRNGVETWCAVAVVGLLDPSLANSTDAGTDPPLILATPGL